MEVYVRVADGEIDRTEEVSAGQVFLDVDRYGKLLGVEVLAAVETSINGNKVTTHGP